MERIDACSQLLTGIFPSKFGSQSVSQPNNLVQKWIEQELKKQKHGDNPEKVEAHSGIARQVHMLLNDPDEKVCMSYPQFVYINKFRYLENLHTFDLQSSNLSDSGLLRKELTGPDLEKHATFRLLKLNKKINDRLEWKSSYGYMGKDTTVSARVSADCPEPEVFRSLFLQQQEDGTTAAKSTSTSKKLSRKFLTDEDISNAGVYGKTYRFGARAELRAPASLTWSNGKINFSFHYNVQC
eukprot:CAMPEP_0172447246 /NCGR_PEP_ID=MMETSP1065-20121228/6589_1 /TAXON_ID=265537 /ORGANISM="Amphiprora paludosa, Strain CCMP125" /LENGTH=239 /DNA_ID=CAMNT_0013198491 /DNA_START=17 /DNA_END=737 /DNA_ORIENTATION=+